MNDSVKLCIYLCGKDLHFYEKPLEFLLKRFYSQFRMTLKIMTASSCTALLCQWRVMSRVMSRVLSRVMCCLLNQGSLYLSRTWLVMRVMRPPVSRPIKVLTTITYFISIVFPEYKDCPLSYLLNYGCLFNKVWDWKIFTINLRLATCQRWRISSDTPYIATLHYGKLWGTRQTLPACSLKAFYSIS